MTKEELEKEADDYADKHAFRVPYDGSNKFYDDVDFKASKEGYLAGAKPREKRIAELEEKISILLSCKNCPENKGGYICEKEYEDKCLAQKIQYIKELKEENAELKKQVEQKQHLADVRLEQSLENYKLFSDERKARIDVDIALDDTTDQLTKAKELLTRFVMASVYFNGKETDLIKETEQFLKESE